MSNFQPTEIDILFTGDVRWGWPRYNGVFNCIKLLISYRGKEGIDEEFGKAWASFTSLRNFLFVSI